MLDGPRQLLLAIRLDHQAAIRCRLGRRGTRHGEQSRHSRKESGHGERRMAPHAPRSRLRALERARRRQGARARRVVGRGVRREDEIWLSAFWLVSFGIKGLSSVTVAFCSGNA